MFFKDSVVGLLILFVCWINCWGSDALGFDVHHRYSDSVKDFLDLEGLPEKDSLDYFAVMAHRDHLNKARRLATTPATSPFLTFIGSNETYRISSLGFLHYSFVSVGTPPLSFLVALDTGSDLFWLPCDCTECVRSLNSTSGKIDLNIYSPNASSTALPIPCNSTKCGQRRACALRRNACAYQEVYLSSNTSSTGILVDDVLHLGTDENPQKPVSAPITLGCGIIQTGDFIDGAAINGLFGLGMDNVSVPSILANKGLAANSFSMCFGGRDGVGRIEFGDKGTTDQGTTPFNLESSHPSYNVTVTNIVVGRNATKVEFSAIFDSGTSFTYLNDPAYSVIANAFDSQVTEPRYTPETQLIFDYCYSLSATQDSFLVPDLNLTFKGGDKFPVIMPTVVIPRQGGYAYCLAIVKSEDIDIIGQNFMRGYRMVFDREEMVLGWSESNCYDKASGSNTLPVNKGNKTSDAPAPSILNPEATPRPSALSPPPPPPSPSRLPSGLPFGSGAARLSSITNGLLMAVASALFYHFLILSS